MIDNNYFNSIIHPISENKFFNNYWNKDFLYIEGDPKKFSHLLSWEKINHLLEYQRINNPRLRIVKNGNLIKPEEYYEFSESIVKNSPQIQRLKIEKVSEFLRDGSVLVIDSISEAIPEIYELTRNFEWKFGDRVQANCYIAWNQSVGFETHWDNHDVFVIQIIGKKKWRIYGKTRESPLRYDNFQNDAPKNPIWENVISAGDIIYIPRGCWHDAIAVDGPTVHISVGIHKLKGYNYLKWFANELLNDITIRSDIPRERTLGNQKEYFELLKLSVFNHLTYESFENYLNLSDGLTVSPLSSSLPYSVSFNDNIQIDSIVRINTKREIKFLYLKDSIKFTAHKKTWEFSAITKTIFEKLNLGRDLAVKDLITDEIDEKQIIQFVGKLVELNLVSIINY